MIGESTGLEASYAYCRQIARSSRSNFYRAFLLLGPQKRRAMDALYAFMRHTDDLGDNDRPVATRQVALAQWRAELLATLAGQTASGPESSLLPAVADTVQRFRIPAEHLLAVLDGVQMDLDGQRYETFSELAEYCRRVASAVGLACLHIWGFQGDQALSLADQCGLAFQLTNILRDLGEDVRQGRVYLPREEFCQYGYSVEDLAAGVADARFLRLMQFQLDRAEQFYRESAGLQECLQPDGRRIFGMMISVYYQILQNIRREPAAVLSRRVALGWFPKTRILARWLLVPNKRLVLS